MGFKTRRVTITDEPTRLTSRETGVGEKNSLAVVNLDDTHTIDVGAVDVEAEAGWPVFPGRVYSVDLEGREAAYAVAPNGETVEVAVSEEGI